MLADQRTAIADATAAAVSKLADQRDSMVAGTRNQLESLGTLLSQHRETLLESTRAEMAALAKLLGDQHGRLSDAAHSGTEALAAALAVAPMA